MEIIHRFFDAGFIAAFGKPGVTSVILSMLLVAAWAFAFIKRGGFWISLGLSALIGGCIVCENPAPGVFIALCAGLALPAAYSRDCWSRNRILAVVAVMVLWVAAGLFAVPKNPVKPKRSEENISFANRVSIWKAVPHMLLDAPHGWGASDSAGWDANGTGPAYMLGYQPFSEQYQEYRTLAGSHLTWLAEWGWRDRGLYVFAWALVAVLVWPSAGRRWFSIPAGIFLVLWVHGFFGNTMFVPAVWVVPSLAMLVALGLRIALKAWPSARGWIFAAAAPAAVFLLTVILSLLFPLQAPVFHEGNRTVIGYGPPRVWFIHPYVDVLGHHFGQGIRSIVISAREKGCPVAVGVARNLDDAKSVSEADTIYVFSYKNISRPLPADARRLVFLNTWLTGEVEWPASRAGRRDIVIIGAKMFNNNNDGLAKDKERWKGIAAADASFTLTQLDSTGYFLPMPAWRDKIAGLVMEEFPKPDGGKKP